jgi:hypothetical protein
MAGRYSMTIHVAPYLPGHLALVVNTPGSQRYVGFGPKDKGLPFFGSYFEGKFDVHPMQAGQIPPADFSSAMGHGPRDYAYVGRGYDTPSERLAHFPSPDNSPTLNDRFGNWTASSEAVAPNLDQVATGAVKKPMRVPERRFADTSAASPFEVGVPPVPFVLTDNPLAPAPPVSFNDRYGMPSPVGAPSNPDQAAQPQSGSAMQPGIQR